MKRLLLLVLVCSFIGCGGVALKRQLDRIDVGMTQREVQEILGEPYSKGSEEVTGSGTLVVWEYKKMGIFASFDEDVPTPEDKKAQRYYVHFLDGRVTKLTRAHGEVKGP